MAKAAELAGALRRLQQYTQGKTVQPGMFSTLDEIIADAPFEKNNAEQWASYLQPGRMLKREGIQFPLKKEELEFSGLSERLSSGILGDQPLTKADLREHLKSGRPEFRVDVGKERYDVAGGNPMIQGGDAAILDSWWEAGKLGRADPKTGDPLDLSRVRAMDPKFGAEYGGGERYHHTSPNSTYEESFTRMKGLVAPTHHTEDTLSWSRITTHELPQKSFEIGFEPRRVRLVEEIQADVHRKANQKLWFNPEDKKFYTNKPSAEMSTGALEQVEEVGRVGYRDEGTALEMVGLRETAAQLDAQLKNLDPLTPSGSMSKKYYRLNEEFQDTMIELERLEMKVGNAPHKSPQEYAQLELRKQLMNAVDDGQDYLALTRGRDQIQRYGGIEGELDARQQAGLERMYDKIYPGELKKLAKRYGATVEDIEIEVNRHVDPDELPMPESMAAFGFEDVHDMVDGTYHALGDTSNMDTAIEGLDVMRETMKDISLTEGAMQKKAANIVNRIDVMDSEVVRLETGMSKGDKYAYDEWNLHVDGKWSELSADYKDVFADWQEVSGVGESGMITKSFPAIHITPEVREKILNTGVPQFQFGGLVTRPDPMPGMEYIPSMEVLRGMTKPELERVRDINYILSGGETADEVNRVRKLDQLYNDPQYWKDVPSHALAALKSMWKTLDPETGEASWNFGAAPPPFELVERGLMPIEEWAEMKEVADRMREEKPARPGIIDETIAMRALMTEFANIFRDKRIEPPEYATEAAQRTERLQRAVEEGMGLDPAVGFPQRFAQMAGFMLGQIPSPKSLTEAAGEALVKIAPKFTAKVPRALKVGIGAPMEFIDPTIRPSLATYLTGATAGTGMIYGIEAIAESRLKELEEKLEDAEQE